jgi:hypothetical protein
VISPVVLSGNWAAISARISARVLMVERGGYWKPEEKPEEKPVGPEPESFFSMPSLSPIWGRYI